MEPIDLDQAKHKTHQQHRKNQMSYSILILTLKLLIKIQHNKCCIVVKANCVMKTTPTTAHKCPGCEGYIHALCGVKHEASSLDKSVSYICPSCFYSGKHIKERANSYEHHKKSKS